MGMYSISFTRNNVLPLRLSYYPSLKHMVGGSFFWEMNTLQSAGLHILTYGVNNLTLAVI